MKKHILLLPASVILTSALLGSCGKSGGEVAQIVAERDSLRNETMRQRESLANLDTLVSVINSGIDSIAWQEGMLFISNGENGIPTRQEIIDKVDRMKRKVAEQREIIQRLEQRLKENKDNGTANDNGVTNLLANVKKKLEEKDREIAELHKKLEQKDVDIAELRSQVGAQNKRIAELDRRNALQTEALQRQDAMLNQCYMAIGPKKLLQQKGIIKKGKLVAQAALDRSKFAKVDIRKVTELNFPAKKPKILTAMPPSSYTLTTTDKNNFTLSITDPTAFWSISNYLVIQTD